MTTTQVGLQTALDDLYSVFPEKACRPEPEAALAQGRPAR